MTGLVNVLVHKEENDNGGHFQSDLSSNSLQLRCCVDRSWLVCYHIKYKYDISHEIMAGFLLPLASAHLRSPRGQQSVPELPAFAHITAAYMTLSGTCVCLWSTHPGLSSSGSAASVTALVLL